DGLRKTQSAPAKGSRTLDPSTLGQDRLDPRSLLPTRMLEFLQSRRLCVISIQNGSSAPSHSNRGYSLFSLTRASAVVNCQSALACCLLRLSCQAETSLARVCLF